MAKLIAGRLGALLLSGCISGSEARLAAAGPCRVGAPMVETMLFLGMARPDGSVSRYEFQQFIAAEVAPRWKEGFTILEGEGLWLSEQRGVTEHESSRVPERFHDGGAEASAGVEAIRDAYIKTFEEDAMLRTDRTTCADF
ncbi:MAG: hypothetical protein B7Y90_18370 [Alphaproteobacteria bacterium 32-64-14]|nr:MAG: hypothetical protein B7Y90_18370 [Alphaproteobacteria bacterium 32-64-14]